jgi:BirA family biotin operon repressor/biotin-[acetyl-CoA-carboxylase] ligase
VSGPTATPSSADGWPEPFDVTWIAETGSTNADLVTAARQGARHGTVLVADHQTAGRGRLGRSWVVPPGSALLCSILVRAAPTSLLHGAVWAVGLAAQAAVRDVAGVDVELKWPNDLMAGERKLAGILAESVDLDGDDRSVVVGLGLNVSWNEPPAEVAADAVTVEELAGRPVERADLLRALLGELAPLLRLWTADPAALHGRYRSHLATIGRRVRVSLPGGDVRGDAIDLTDDGALVVQVEGERVIVAAGDVVHLRSG